MLIKIIKRTLIVFTISVHSFYAQNKEKIIPQRETQKAFGNIDLLSIKMPNNNEHEQNMGFAGIHYNLKLNNWSYLGTGIYGAITGVRGGFFTLGINAGIQPRITKKLFIDTGLHFGGGGGASAPDGGGAFILPHFNLGYDFKNFSTTAGYSYINFFDKGAINSSQWNLALQIPLFFETTKFKKREKFYTIEKLRNTKWDYKSKRISLLIHLNSLNVIKGSYKSKVIRLTGFELNSYLNNRNIFFFVKADGAYHGVRAGYMDVFLGAGYHVSINENRTNILAKFGIGAGGGGAVDTKGGLLVYPDISIEQKIFGNIYGSINKGYMMTPDTHFTSSTLGFGLKYYLDKDGIIDNKFTEIETFSKVTFKGLEVILKQDLYLDAERDDKGGFTQDMHQISLQINLFLNKYIYGAGQTSFANFGGAGAYAEGIIGLGIESNSFLNSKTSVFAQLLAGAAGGGGISTGQGLIVKPSIGINYKLSEQLSIRGAAGYVKSYRGKLSNAYFNFGINYHFSFLLLSNQQ